MLAGSADSRSGNWWLLPSASAGLFAVGVVAAALVGGAVGTVLLVAAVIVALPALMQGLVMTVVAALTYYVPEPDPEPVIRRAAKRVLRVALLISVVAGVVGVVLYASAPDVASYQASSLLVLPIFIVALAFAHHRLSTRIEWPLAVVLAIAGPVGYVVVGGDQWWNWGQFAVYPFVFLAMARGFRTVRATDPAARQARLPSGMGGGPFGPP